MAPGLSSGYFDNKKNYVSIYVKAVVPLNFLKCLNLPNKYV